MSDWWWGGLHLTMCVVYLTPNNDAPGVSAALQRYACRAAVGRDDVSFRRDATGRPRCPELTSCGLDHNTSHAAGFIAVAVGVGPLGIDVEGAGRDLGTMLCTVFPDAAKALSASASQHTKVWTQLEAVLKRSGRGLSGLRTVRFTDQGWVRPPPKTAFRDLALAHYGLVGTVCGPVEAPPPTLRFVESSELS